MKPNRSLPVVLSLSLGLSLGLAARPALAQSLYNAERFQALTSDRRAIAVGDSLTVLVFENASASQSADTVTEKSSGINVGVGANARNYSARGSVGDESAGKGRVQRSGRLAAQITVTVSEVTANGDLRIAGKQHIVVNGEKQLLQLAGRVRPADVSDTNTIASTRIADAEISYVGDGMLADRQRQGALTRFMNWLGL